MFPDVEKAIAELLVLAGFAPSSDHVGSSTPANLEAVLPFIQVVRYGGGDNWVTDQAAVDVDYFAATRQAAIDGARAVHAFLISGPHRIGPVLIDHVNGDVGPVERPRAGTLRRFGGTYTVSARRLPA